MSANEGDRVRIDYADDPYDEDHGKEGLVERRLDGVWADMVTVRLEDGTRIDITDQHLEVLA